MALEDKITLLPTSPGVYLMRDKDGTIIYVGKARNLRQRVRSYFRASGDSRQHIVFLVNRIADIEVMLTDTEKEALLLENTLIKQYRPRYNLDLKDDKTFFSLRIDPRTEFPRFTVVRRIPDDTARYFGPYVSSTAAREVLRQLQRMFPLRHYPLKTCMARKRPCLYHQLNQCSAPCHGLITSTEYGEFVKAAMLFLDGKGKQVVAGFKQLMQEAATQLRYEEAARWRNLLRSIEVTVERQKMVMRDGNTDVIGYYRDGTHLELALLFVRGGTMGGSRLFSLEWELDDAEGIAAFLRQYYLEGADIPDEILVPLKIEESDTLGLTLTEIKGKKLVISTPVRGIKRELVELADKNAAAAAREREQAVTTSADTLAELHRKLHLTRLPKTIECYDISTIQGRFSVGSGITFQDGKPDKQRYRRYRIRTVQGQDDFAMLREVFTRRFQSDDSSTAPLPDLVVVDGGIGQLQAVSAIIEELGLTGQFDLVSLAKSRTRRDMQGTNVQKSDERVFLPGRRNPVVLRQNSQPLLLLTAIRDEAHRFAIEYHRSLRSKAGISSGLEQIPGIGAKRKMALLQQFGSMQGLRDAGVEAIAGVTGMNQTMAQAVYDWVQQR